MNFFDFSLIYFERRDLKICCQNLFRRVSAKVYDLSAKPISEGLFRRVICEGNMLPKPISEGLFRRVISRRGGWRRFKDLSTQLIGPQKQSSADFAPEVAEIPRDSQIAVPENAVIIKEDLSTQSIDPQDPSLPDFAPEVAEIPKDSQIAIPEMASASTPKRKQQPNSTTAVIFSAAPRKTRRVYRVTRKIARQIPNTHGTPKNKNTVVIV